MSGLALEVAYKEARVWRVEAEAARRIAQEWNALAIADGYGGGAVKAHDLLDAMDKARAQHEAKEEADLKTEMERDRDFISAMSAGIPPLTPPDPVAADEASEGMCALPELTEQQLAEGHITEERR